MKKPTIKRGPASHYAGAGEAIVEFSDGQSGGLISVRRDAEGRMIVDVYRADEDVVVRSAQAAFACAECGTTTATTYVVTTLDPEDVKGTRTEVCRACDDKLRANDHPEGSTAICAHCGARILLDQREGGGPGKDWGDSPEDWVGNGGIGMDYGCGENPENDDEGTGGHLPKPGTIKEPEKEN